MQAIACSQSVIRHTPGLRRDITYQTIYISIHVSSLVQLLPHTKKVKRGPKNWRVVALAQSHAQPMYLGKCIGDCVALRE